MSPGSQAPGTGPADGGDQTLYYLATTELTKEEYEAHALRSDTDGGRMPPTLLQESGYPGHEHDKLHEDLIPHILKDAALTSGLLWPEGMDPAALDPEECNVRDWPLEQKAEIMSRAWSNWKPGVRGTKNGWTTGFDTAAALFRDIPHLGLLFTGGPAAVARMYDMRRRGACPEDNSNTRFTNWAIERTLRGELLWKGAAKGAFTAAGGLQGTVTAAPAGGTAVAMRGSRNSGTLTVTAEGDSADTLLAEAHRSNAWRIGCQHEAAEAMTIIVRRTRAPTENMEAVAAALIAATEREAITWRCAEYQDSAVLSAPGGFAYHTLQWPKDHDGEGRVVLRSERDGRPIGEMVQGEEKRQSELLRDLWYAALRSSGHDI